MKNVVIFGINYELVLNLSKQLAKILNCKIVDAEKQFNNILLKYADKPALLLNDEIEKQETNLCAKLCKVANLVAIPDDMFLSNENYNHFNNSIKIFVQSGTKSKLKIGIENLLQLHSNLTINKLTVLEEVAKKLK